ncbi:unnamed protein product [Rhizophagus irregularis]|nr:unnamed protein product [Rhizophagus irregularis]
MKQGVSLINISREVLAANCLEQTRETSAKSADQLPPPIAWSSHGQLLVAKQLITSPPIAWSRHEMIQIPDHSDDHTKSRQLAKNALPVTEFQANCELRIMTAVLRTKTYLDFKANNETNTYVYFKMVEARFWQLKHYLGFRLKTDEIILPWSTVYCDWQTSLKRIAQNTIKKFPGCITVFCKDLLDICNTFEGSEVRKKCEDLYNEFYQRHLDKQIAERIRILDSTVFSERKFSEFLRNTSDKKRIGEDNEVASSSSEKRIRLEEDVPSEPFKDHEDEEVYDYDDEISDVKAMNFSIEESETEEISQPEAVQVESSLFNAWILSTGKNVSQVLENYRLTIPKSKAYLYPAFFGILDLSGKIQKSRNCLPTMNGTNNSSRGNNTTTSNEAKRRSQEETLYDLFDKIQEVIRKKPDDLITAIEKCTIEGNSKINSIRRLIQAYAYNLERLQTSIPEAMFSNNFTNMITKGILTYHQKFIYDEGEIQSIASAFITNSTKKPTDRSLIGQKCDFRVTCDGFEMVIGLRSGGLPEACKSKKLSDKIDLMVAMRDVLLHEAIDNNGV